MDLPSFLCDENRVFVPSGGLLPFRQITDIPEYRFTDIRPEDIVVDIGANIGAFCIRAAWTARQVTAVEPVTYAQLRENIRLNRVSVRILEGALGNGKPADICWDDHRVSFPDIHPSEDQADRRRLRLFKM